MNSIAVIALSLAAFALILYLADFKFELKFKKSSSENDYEGNTAALDKLSNRELRILKMVSEGKTNQEISDELCISVHTVKKHVSNIFKKLNLGSRNETRKYKNQIDI